MGLADLVKEIREDRAKLPGQRLFDHIRNRPPEIKPPMKPGDFFRISSLPYLCPREEVLAFQHDVVRMINYAPGLQITFDIGNLFHDLYRDQYFGPMGEWGGAWECKRCGWDTDKAGLSHAPVKGGHMAKLTTMPESCPDCGAVRPAPCLECGRMAMNVCGQCGAVRPGVDPESEIVAGGIITFKEWSVKDNKLCLKGHPDGWRIIPGEKPSIVDLKSHGSNGFVSRNSLREGHDVQVWSYQHCSNETDRTGEVYYMNKSPWGDHSAFIRTIAAPFDKRIFDYTVRKPLVSLQEGLDGGKMPDRICISDDTPKAKGCQLASVCF